MADWADPEALEAGMKELGGTSVDIDSPNGLKYQTLSAMLQAIRAREQVEVSQRLARSTWWMAAFVALASVAQVLTVILAFSRR